jgi:hypothetical protein
MAIAVNVRFSLITDEPPHRSEMTRCATSGLMHRSKVHVIRSPCRRVTKATAGS